MNLLPMTEGNTTCSMRTYIFKGWAGNWSGSSRIYIQVLQAHRDIHQSCYYLFPIRNVVFSGDTLLCISVHRWRTDFPGRAASPVSFISSVHQGEKLSKADGILPWPHDRLSRTNNDAATKAENEDVQSILMITVILAFDRKWNLVWRAFVLWSKRFSFLKGKDVELYLYTYRRKHGHGRKVIANTVFWVNRNEGSSVFGLISVDSKFHHTGWRAGWYLARRTFLTGGFSNVDKECIEEPLPAWEEEGQDSHCPIIDWPVSSVRQDSI